MSRILIRIHRGFIKNFDQNSSITFFYIFISRSYYRGASFIVPVVTFAFLYNVPKFFELRLAWEPDSTEKVQGGGAYSCILTISFPVSIFSYWHILHLEFSKAWSKLNFDLAIQNYSAILTTAVQIDTKWTLTYFHNSYQHYLLKWNAVMAYCKFKPSHQNNFTFACVLLKVTRWKNGFMKKLHTTANLNFHLLSLFVYL